MFQSTLWGWAASTPSAGGPRAHQLQRPDLPPVIEASTFLSRRALISSRSPAYHDTVPSSATGLVFPEALPSSTNTPLLFSAQGRNCQGSQQGKRAEEQLSELGQTPGLSFRENLEWIMRKGRELGWDRCCFATPQHASRQVPASTTCQPQNTAPSPQALDSSPASIWATPSRYRWLGCHFKLL